MQLDNILEQRLLKKLRQLPPEQLSKVEDFINSLYKQNVERSLTLTAAKLSEPVLQSIWDNSDDAAYDKL